MNSPLTLIDLFGMLPEEIHTILGEKEVPLFQARQIFRWIQKKGVSDFSQMSDLSHEVKGNLQRIFTKPGYKISDRIKGKDRSTKWLIEFADGKKVESVAIGYKGGYTLCVSSQVGCSGGCAHCYSALVPFQRNLTPGEIICQIMASWAELGEPPHNVVFMGMGEPLLNLTNVLKVINLLTHPQGQKMGYRRITVSTVGITLPLKKIIEFKHPINLVISLHTANSSKRDEFLPITSKHPLDRLYPTLLEYNQSTGRRISFAVTLIRGFNDEREDAEKIARYLKGLTSHVNLIKLNSGQIPLSFRGKKLVAASERRLGEFRDWLKAKNIPVSIRISKGEDIGAACGMLIAKQK